MSWLRKCPSVGSPPKSGAGLDTRACRGGERFASRARRGGGTSSRDALPAPTGSARRRQPPRASRATKKFVFLFSSFCFSFFCVEVGRENSMKRIVIFHPKMREFIANFLRGRRATHQNFGRRRCENILMLQNFCVELLARAMPQTRASSDRTCAKFC